LFGGGRNAAEGEGRFLLNFNYTDIDSQEGVTSVLSSGFTWLINPSLRLGASIDLARFNPDNDPASDVGEAPSTRGLGDSTFSLQYDWQERLTASPWVPDDVGTSVAILVPTGDAKKALGGDTWAASIAVSRPILIKGEWLVNPVINYNFTFNEGELADHIKVAEVGVGLVKLFPSRVWIAYTPSYWYDFDFHTWNFDSHLTIGKMFSTGIGMGLDYGTLARHFKPEFRDDRTLLINLYYQFGH
jgi:hypothetical protein